VTLLEQQELMAPPPRRRLIVPKGHTAIWGCDGSTLRLAIAALWRQEGGSVVREVHTVSFAPSDGPQRLSTIYADTMLCARRAAHDMGPGEYPGLIVVEQPSGKTPNLNLVYAIGVIQAALYDGVYDVTGVPPRMETISSASWKKRACGRGNLYKPQREKGGPPVKQTDYAVFRWAVENGWNPRSWDEADAAGICEAAWRDVILEER
jgi:hypothetical protein